MPVPVIVILSMVAAIVGLGILIALIGPVFRGIGWAVRGLFWLIAHLFRFVYSTVADALRFVGAVIAAVLFVPFILLNIVIARWSAAAHFGRSLQREIGAGGAALYRLAIGNPARLLLLNAVTEGIERRIPEAIAQAPGADKPSKATGAFPGYKVVGSLRAGGSGGRLFVAEPLPEKKAALARAGVPLADQVVIKAFSVKDGATLDQIVRESRALEAARRLHLILDHELSSERFYYVMTYVPGENLSIVTQQLHARAGDGGLRGDTLRDALSYGRELLRTLDRYHGAGLWHKDIKPDNIIVHEGQAHLVDLGLVTPLASGMTLTTHGTEYFRDPEMVRMALRGVKVHEVDGVKFDIYGVGAVLYSVVENSFPAHGGLSQISKGCPEALRWTIRRSMTDLVHRYPSARMMLADLDYVAKAADPFAVKPAELPSMREGVETFSAIWDRICAHQNEPFSQKRGGEFSYGVSGNTVIPDRTNRSLPKSDFEKAYARMPVSGPGKLQDLQGPSYLFAILTDPRISEALAHRASIDAPFDEPRESEFASIPASFSAERAGTPRPPRPERAPEGAAAPRGRPRIRVTDWWTGRYEANESGAPRRQAQDREAPFIGVAAASVGGANRPKSGRSAREQVASARGRAQQRQRDVRKRISRRGDRFNAGPNPGVAFAVVGLLGLVAFVVFGRGNSKDTSAAAAAPSAVTDAEMVISMRVVSPRGVWDVEASGGEEMLVVNEEEPNMRCLVIGADDDEVAMDVAPAAFFPRLMAGPMGTGRVGVLWDRASMDKDGLMTLHAVADLLEDGGATLVGYDDDDDDLDAAARMRAIIGVSRIEDSAVWSSLRTWMHGEDVGSVILVERDVPWVVFDATGAGLMDAMDHAAEVPPPPARIAPSPPPAPQPQQAPAGASI